MSKKLEEFKYVCWKNFDRLLYKDMPNLSVECRVQLADNWDKHIEKFERMYEDILSRYNAKASFFYEEPRADGFKELWGTELEDMLKKHEARK